jgi:rRNA maturation protein Nop10
MPEAPGISQAYCRACGYDLTGLPEPRCPECGGVFDPANPRTFDLRPRRSRFRRRVLWILGFLLLLAGVTGGALLYLHRAWRTDQRAYAQLRHLGIVRIESTGPDWLHTLLGPRHVYLLDRTTDVCVGPMSDDQFNALISLRHVSRLIASYGPMDDPRCASLARMQSLTRLSLSGKEITDAAIPSLCRLKRLESLSIQRTRITDDGVRQLKSLPQLRELNLCGNRLTDASFDSLIDLPNLRTLYITVRPSGDGFTPEGVERFQQRRTDVTVEIRR